jgi:branched-chain amino acid transport system permease protein
VGGYLTALLNTQLGLGPLVAIPIAALGGGLVCTLLLLPCLPLRGVYFAIVTLMYPLFLARMIEALDILGGTDGIMGIDSFPMPGWSSMVIIVLLLLILFGMRRLVNTDQGLVMRAVKDNDQAVRASGISVTHYKALAVFIASSVGCLAGACMVHIYMWAGSPPLPWIFRSCPSPPRSSAAAGPWWGRFWVPDPGTDFRTAAGLRHVADRFLLIDSAGLHRFPQRRADEYGQRKYQQFERWKDI